VKGEEKAGERGTPLTGAYEGKVRAEGQCRVRAKKRREERKKRKEKSGTAVRSLLSSLTFSLFSVY
jgi:hypothetical protein